MLVVIGPLRPFPSGAPSTVTTGVISLAVAAVKISSASNSSGRRTGRSAEPGVRRADTEMLREAQNRSPRDAVENTEVKWRRHDGGVLDAENALARTFCDLASAVQQNREIEPLLLGGLLPGGGLVHRGRRRRPPIPVGRRRRPGLGSGRTSPPPGIDRRVYSGEALGPTVCVSAS